MPASLEVPGDASTLSEAVDRIDDGGVISIVGQLETGAVQIRKPITLRGGTLVGTDAIVLGLHADVIIEDCAIENDQGHGVVAMAGSPVLRRLSLRVAQTAFACGAQAQPALYGCEVSTCAIGLTAQDDAAPTVDGLTVVSSGSGMFFTGRSAGQVNNVGIVAGGMPAVEINAEATPEFEGVAVALGGGGGFFVHGQARPRLLRCSAERTQLAAVEVRGQADPTIDGLKVRDCQASGLFLHENATGTYMALDIEGCLLASIEVAEHAQVEIEEGSLLDGQQGGLWVHDDAHLEAIGLEIAGHALMGVDVLDRAHVVLDGCEIARNGSGVQVGSGRVETIECNVLGNRGAGVRVLTTGVAALEGGRVAENSGAALDAIEGGRIRITPDVLIEGEQRCDDLSEIVRVEGD